MNSLALFFLLAAAVGQAAWILSDSKISEPLRTWVFQKIEPAIRCRSGWDFGVIAWEDAFVWHWLYTGLNCAYCTGVWFSLMAALILRPDVVAGPAISVIVYALGLALVARLAHVVIERLRCEEES
jgi:hypothetical protein